MLLQVLLFTNKIILCTKIEISKASSKPIIIIMALVKKSTNYAPDIFRALHGILLVHKPARLSTKDLCSELRERISDSLNEFQPRPIQKHVYLEGNVDEDKQIVEVPNLADHPLVVGPRYLPWELSMSVIKPLPFRTSGISIHLLGNANKYFFVPMKRARFVSIYHIAGRFGHMTDNYFYDGKIIDKATFKHIRSGKLDAVLAKIESTQHERLFDSANVPLDSQEAYELAKAWPSRPPNMASWPVIYRMRCIHLNLPHFKIEVTVCNETESFLAQLTHDIGLMIKSCAHTESIRRVKIGPFSIDDSLTDKDWDLQSMLNNLSIHNDKHAEIHRLLRNYRSAIPIRTEYRQSVGQTVEHNDQQLIGSKNIRNRQ